MRWTNLCILLVACGSGGAAAGGADGGGDDGASPFSPPDAEPELVPIYGQCAGRPARPLTAGSYVEPQTGATLHWPEGWTSDNTYRDGAYAPYTFVPTGATSGQNAQAYFGIGPTGVSGQSTQGYLQSRAESVAQNGGRATSIQIGGHPALVWWDEVAPPQPGCQGCPLDPGPDLVEIGVAIDLGSTDAGPTVVEGHGSARVDAVPVDVICDMEAMALGVSFGP